MYFTYILFSPSAQTYYIGYTSDLYKRLSKHNKGGSNYTRKYKPWKLVYFEKFNTKSEAIMRESEIKSYKGGIQFRKLIASR